LRVCHGHFQPGTQRAADLFRTLGSEPAHAGGERLRPRWGRAVAGGGPAGGKQEGPGDPCGRQKESAAGALRERATGGAAPGYPATILILPFTKAFLASSACLRGRLLAPLATLLRTFRTVSCHCSGVFVASGIEVSSLYNPPCRWLI